MYHIPSQWAPALHQNSQWKVVVLICTEVSQLSAYGRSSIPAESIITNCSPLVSTVHLYQTLVNSIPSDEAKLTRIRIMPYSGGVYISITHHFIVGKDEHWLTAYNGHISIIGTGWGWSGLIITLEDDQIWWGGTVHTADHCWASVSTKPVVWDNKY